MLNVVALVLKELQAQNLNCYAEIPDPPPNPVMRVEENGVRSPSSQMPDHLYEFGLELQTWGQTKSSAFALVVDTIQVLRAHPSNEHGAVTRFELVSNSYERDAQTLVNGQPGPRYISIARLWAHP